MTIISKVTSRGDSMTTSLSGDLIINEAAGEIIVRNGTTEVVRIDKTGIHTN